MRILLLLIALLFLFSGVNAQNFCATPTGQSGLLSSIPPSQFKFASSNYVVRVYIHIVRRSDGSGGQSSTSVNNALNYLVNDFESHGICISVLGMSEILNTTYYNQTSFTTDANGDGKFDNFSPNSHTNAVDIYLLGDDSPFGGGQASNIPGTALVIAGSYLGQSLPSSHVLSHELGHCLGLLHTFHGCELGGCFELVNGSNCSACGDEVCDTPADPNWSVSNASGCNWNGVSCTGSSTDANGQPYNPNETLIMAYVPPGCMTHFTTGQGTRMRSMLANSAVLANIIVPNSLTITSLTLNSGNNRLYDVLDDLTAQTSVVVNSGGNLTLRAGQNVYLKNGFHAKAGSSFRGYIETACSTTGSSNSAVALDTNSHIPDGLENNFQVDLRPNPATQIVNLYVSADKSTTVNVKLVSQSGVIIKELNQKTHANGMNAISLQIADIPTGVYFIRVYNGRNVVVKKLVKAL